MSTQIRQTKRQRTNSATKDGRRAKRQEPNPPVKRPGFDQPPYPPFQLTTASGTGSASAPKMLLRGGGSKRERSTSSPAEDERPAKRQEQNPAQEKGVDAPPNPPRQSTVAAIAHISMVVTAARMNARR
ncbi:hypothetical protein K402DRAFT_396622 [Aulographum hederae CBS 113979]|uniref:Uncharacterized protein n=1 Tax=Aulographum hederae CBS 113979 TaxID=1176131 RepID=A0A6G1GR20_9PEZI|nr:hypothetical protein K402DRAFT_396622 [Aulographum hederae CBS 113979]